MKLVVALAVISMLCAVSAYEECVTSTGFQYACSYRCCASAYIYDTTCCIGLASTYWYAWVLITFFFLVCVCACIGCGGYGYRRHYVVRHVEHPAPVVVTSTTASTGYQQFGNQYKGYEAPPPAYDTKSAY